MSQFGGHEYVLLVIPNKLETAAQCFRRFLLISQGLMMNNFVTEKLYNEKTALYMLNALHSFLEITRGKPARWVKYCKPGFFNDVHYTIYHIFSEPCQKYSEFARNYSEISVNWLIEIAFAYAWNVIHFEVVHICVRVFWSQLPWSHGKEVHVLSEFRIILS